MDGEIVYLFLYDLTAPLDNDKVKNIFKNSEDFSTYEHEKSIPEEIATFNVPYTFNLKESEIKLGENVLKSKVQVAIYGIGAFSVRLRIPFSNFTMKMLEQLTFDKGVEAQIKDIISNTKAKTEKAISKQMKVSLRVMTENYRVYFINDDSDTFLKQNKKAIAGIILDEDNYHQLSDSYVQSTLRRMLSYYKNEVVIVDWDAMMFIGKSKKYEHELITAEIANVQLLEFRAYYNEVTRMINTVNERFSRRLSSMLRIFRARSNLIKLNSDIGQFYEETKDMVNNVTNIAFGFGEWYLARLYALCEDAFKLKDWYNSLIDNLEILEKIRGFIADIISEETNAFLEWIIIALITIEIIVGMLSSVNLLHI
ncbi:MAG: hypothetical protein M1348_01520 [Candidatus Parvarchaeota archaeon]|jgi:hypothetical protein|nr:hypothetical protein [Candidatus Parvarchaeota archaeon]MCL5101272.1 hypothetical protein [Candidatus Parvarchaeota archaeon]